MATGNEELVILCVLIAKRDGYARFVGAGKWWTNRYMLRELVEAAQPWWDLVCSEKLILPCPACAQPTNHHDGWREVIAAAASRRLFPSVIPMLCSVCVQHPDGRLDSLASSERPLSDPL